MTSIDTLTTFFGWCLVLNIGIYLLTVVSLTLAGDLSYKVNAKIFGISKEAFTPLVVQYLGHYKLAITMLFFVPWVALKLMI